MDAAKPAEPAPEPAPQPARLAEAVDGMVRARMAEEHLPGVAVVIVESGRTIFERGWGVADLENGRGVDPATTIFRIGSVTKVLTALALTRLVDQGRLSFEDDVAQHMGDVPMKGDYARPVTVMNLVTHTGGFDQIGLDRWIGEFERPLAERKAMRPGLAQFLAMGNLRRVTPPGALFRYDTYGITLGGLVLETITGEPYATAMEHQLFEPLGMARSSVEIEDELRSDLAVGYGYADDRYEPQPYEVYVTTPASSVDATVADMGRLLQALTSDGANEHGRLLGPEANTAVTSAQYRPHPDFVGASHGFREVGWPVHGFEHGGSMLGFTSKLVVYPELRVGYFIAINRDPEAGGGPVRLADELAFAVLESLIEPTPPEPLEVPKAPVETDVSAYLGRYGSGVYCHTCTPKEHARGAWPAGPGVEVTSPGPGLVELLGKRYVSKGDGVFVRDDGRRQLMFGRFDGAVAFLSLSDNPEPMERLAAAKARKKKRKR